MQHVKIGRLRFVNFFYIELLHDVKLNGTPTNVINSFGL